MINLIWITHIMPMTVRRLEAKLSRMVGFVVTIPAISIAREPWRFGVPNWLVAQPT
jgi:hypothetical protein